MPHVRTLVAVLLLLTAASTSAQIQDEEASRRTITAEHLLDGESLVLDGLLDEPFWLRAVPGTDFIQQDPVLGGTPTERTQVRFAFDRDNLYMGVSNFDCRPTVQLLRLFAPVL